MNKFSLELLFQIIGIGSASGIIYNNNSLLIISDNSGFLYEYLIGSTELKKHPIIDNPSANIPKKEKPDFESILAVDDTLYIFGSGSTENRTKLITFDTKTKKMIATIDLSNLYLSMQSFGKINSVDFNIEGVVKDGTNWYFFQRGNGGTGKNGIFTVQAKNLEENFSILYNEFQLPKINNVQSTFTDAVLVDKEIYFLATAENTSSAYDDGEVMGSLIGKIDLKKMKVGKTKIISNQRKFEGITLFEKNSDSISFLLCEDNDSDKLESGIFKLSIQL